jgi:hypothetical protein
VGGLGLGEGRGGLYSGGGPVGKWAARWWFVGRRALPRGCQPGSRHRELFAESKALGTDNFTQI